VILHFPVFFLPFALCRQQQTHLVLTVQQLIEASSLSSLFQLLSIYPAPESQFILHRHVSVDQTVTPETHKNPETYNLILQAVKRYSNSCCTDSNNSTQLITNTLSVSFTNYWIASKRAGSIKWSDIKYRIYQYYQSSIPCLFALTRTAVSKLFTSNI